MKTAKYIIRKLILGVMLIILFNTAVFAAENPLGITAQVNVSNGETVITFWSNGQKLSFQDIMNSKDESGFANYSQVYINDSSGVQVFTVDLADENRVTLSAPNISNGELGAAITSDSIVVPEERNDLKIGFYNSISDNSYDWETDAEYWAGTTQEALEGAMETASGLAEDYVLNPLEETICELMLAAGDFFVSIINKIIGEEITVTALVYNEVDAVNPNFFDSSVNGSGITADIKSVIEDWYGVLRLIAIAMYIVALLAIGVSILLASTSSGTSKAKESLTEWVKGIIILTFMPYVMKYAFILNEEIINLLKSAANAPTSSYGGVFGNTEEWSAEEIEFRSPEYVSRYTGQIEYGSDEASTAYLNKVPEYEQKIDLMRIMRAYAGVTKKFVYAVIWWILIGQLLAFIIQYYKRYFIIAFLIVMFPIVCTFQAVAIGRGLKSGEMSSWTKELFTNIFMQMIQAIIYTIITSVCISTVQVSMTSTATLNWLLVILAINFVSDGEKMLRKILGAMGSTADGVGKSGQGVKGAFNRVKSTVKRYTTGKDED